MIENKNNYLIKKKRDDRKKEDKVKKEVEDEEINDLIKSSALLAGLEVSNDMRTMEPIAGWRYPKKYLKLTEEHIRDIRLAYKIEVEGEDLLPPISQFKDMHFPEAIMKALNKKKISYPSPIQMQCLPIVLSGRDLIGIAFTGSGKSLVFILPAIMIALEEQSLSKLRDGEGPFVMIIVPSRELAIQIYENVSFFIKYLLKSDYPQIKSALCIGGVDIKYQIDDIAKGVHIVVGTPGRLSDLLDKKKLNASMCKYLVLDEADRLLDMGFDEEIKRVMEKIKNSRQTVIFSSTMPKKIQAFAKLCLCKPVVVNVGRAGAANLNVVQEVEYIKEESKLLNLLETLQKTPPPVIIFCENKNDVDEISEYLLLKGVDVCSMHGDKDQEERYKGLREFKEGLKDVLVATDIVSKGLDFTDIEHIINYDMPKEVRK